MLSCKPKIEEEEEEEKNTIYAYINWRNYNAKKKNYT
jgi:hypothetical protein